MILRAPVEQQCLSKDYIKEVRVLKKSILQIKEIVLKYLLQEWDKKDSRSKWLMLTQISLPERIKGIDKKSFINAIQCLESNGMVKIHCSGSTIEHSTVINVVILPPALEYFDKQKRAKRNSRKLTRREIILMILSALFTGVVAYFVAILTPS